MKMNDTQQLEGIRDYLKERKQHYLDWFRHYARTDNEEGMNNAAGSLFAIMNALEKLDELHGKA